MSAEATRDGSSRWKARLLGSVVMAVALWPIAHYGLVTRLDVNPWKLYGFAMYCTPHLLSADLWDTSLGVPRRIPSRSLPEPARSSWRRFLERRYVVGQLATPDEAAHAIFAAVPSLRALRIEITTEQLGWMQATTIATQRRYDFARPDDS